MRKWSASENLREKPQQQRLPAFNGQLCIWTPHHCYRSLTFFSIFLKKFKFGLVFYLVISQSLFYLEGSCNFSQLIIREGSETWVGVSSFPNTSGLSFHPLTLPIKGLWCCSPLESVDIKISIECPYTPPFCDISNIGFI